MIYLTKENAHFDNDIAFCITQQWGTGKLPPSKEALYSLISLPTLLTILELLQNRTISLMGLN